MVYWPMVAEPIVAGDLNKKSENGRNGGGNVGIQDISAHFFPATESVLILDTV